MLRVPVIGTPPRRRGARLCDRSEPGVNSCPAPTGTATIDVPMGTFRFHLFLIPADVRLRRAGSWNRCAAWRVHRRGTGCPARLRPRGAGSIRGSRPCWCRCTRARARPSPRSAPGRRRPPLLLKASTACTGKSAGHRLAGRHDPLNVRPTAGQDRRPRHHPVVTGMCKAWLIPVIRWSSRRLVRDRLVIATDGTIQREGARRRFHRPARWGPRGPRNVRHTPGPPFAPPTASDLSGAVREGEVRGDHPNRATGSRLRQVRAR